MNKIEKLVHDLAKPVAESQNCYLYDVEYVKEGSEWYLRIFIDNDDGVGIDECEAVSRILSDKLDEADPISDNYFLEVSSPGIERKLTQDWHFEMYTMDSVDIKLYKAIDGKKKYTGILKAYDGKTLVIEYNGADIVFETDNIISVKLHYEFGGI